MLQVTVVHFFPSGLIELFMRESVAFDSLETLGYKLDNDGIWYHENEAECLAAKVYKEDVTP